MPDGAAAGLAQRSPAVLASLRLAAGLVVLLLTVGLFFGGAQPVAAGLFKPGWDKLAHVVVFACMGFAYGLASGGRGWRMLLWSVLGALAVGSMDELHQFMLPGREPGWDDLLADGVGGLLGGLGLQAGYAWLKWRERRRAQMGPAGSASTLQRAPGATA